MQRNPRQGPPHSFATSPGACHRWAPFHLPVFLPCLCRRDDAGPISAPPAGQILRHYQGRFAYRAMMAPETRGPVTIDTRSGQGQALFFAAPFCFAHLRFCAAAIRARASGLNMRFFTGDFACVAEPKPARRVRTC